MAVAAAAGAAQCQRNAAQHHLSRDPIYDAAFQRAAVAGNHRRKRQLTRLFSETIHIGFHEYLLDLRTEHAKTLLQNTKLPITDIAFQSGFESQRTFNRAFRDFFHVTPREYRKRLALQHQNAAAADTDNADEDCP